MTVEWCDLNDVTFRAGSSTSMLDEDDSSSSYASVLASDGARSPGTCR